jgi:hypothetical protein
LPDRAAEEGIAPLEVMLADMRAKQAAGDLGRRACDCAPSLHPRLSSISAHYRRIMSIQQLTNDELLSVPVDAPAKSRCPAMAGSRHPFASAIDIELCRPNART